MVVPGLFNYLRKSDEICFNYERLRKRRQREARKNAIDLIGDFPPLKNQVLKFNLNNSKSFFDQTSEEDLISEEDEASNSEIEENEPNEEWFSVSKSFGMELGL